jgi:phosphatidylserine/phosphatidylglycerophosphate/cardiolipin synthase-like enzyme
MRRRIHRASGSSSSQISDVLQTIFALELLAPSRCLWLISPWISDVAVLDNSAGGFVALEPTWGYRHVRISELLARLASQGTAIVIATRPAEHNDHFLARVRESAGALGAAEKIRLWRKDESDLHEKGLLTDRLYVAGSMNFTYKGIVVNEEAVTVSADPAEVAEVRLTYHRRWGGVL